MEALGRSYLHRSNLPGFAQLHLHLQPHLHHHLHCHVNLHLNLQLHQCQHMQLQVHMLM